MDYQGFIATVREGAHIPGEEAERAACATLQTLGERVTRGEAEDLAERLPEQLRSCLTPAGPDSFHVDEFLRRVGERAGVDPQSAQRDTVAVLAAMWRAVGPDEYADLRAELPKDFQPLFDEALANEPPPYVVEPTSEPLLSADEFIARVAERAHLDRDAARRATEAVLEALAMRITGGQVSDLEAQVAPELRPALERGRIRSGGRARALSLDTFLGEVARLEGVSRSQATEHARAVLNTLREAVGQKEWSDTRAQLPNEYRDVLRRG